MPRFQPVHHAFEASEPSPLRLYWYTAADIEEEVANAPTAQPVQPGPAREHNQQSAVAPRGQAEDPEECREQDVSGESPRKRRRITTTDGSDPSSAVDLTIQFAPRSQRSPTSQPRGIDASTQSSPTMPDATWSFRNADAVRTAQQSHQEVVIRSRTNGADDEKLDKTSPSNFSTLTTERIDSESIAASRNAGTRPVSVASAAQSSARRPGANASSPSLAGDMVDTAVFDSPDDPVATRHARAGSPDEVPLHAPVEMENHGLGRLMRVRSLWS